ncbi:MAG: hypothetical protein PHI11_03805 [Gallionella sp.]|nr:hypothetical protein [Gallionella sp.]
MKISTSLFCLCLGCLTLPVAAIEEITNATPIDTPVSPVVSAVPHVPTQKKSTLTFMDSKLFDGKLARELEAGNDVVEIEVSGRIPLNNIPARIDRWLVTSADEGTVETLPSPPNAHTKGVFVLIPMVFSAFGYLKNMREEKMYDTAKQYDTKIYYRKEENGESLIDKIVLVKRKPGEHHH